jgi:hypothetical protein
MDTFLLPIEKPQSLIMKLAYYFTRRHFGKVLRRLKCIPRGYRLRSVCSTQRSASSTKS